MSNNNSIRLLIAVADARLRQALSTYFSMQGDIEVVGQTADFAQTRTLSNQLEPHILLLDSEIRLERGTSFLSVLRQQQRNPKIVVLAAAATGLTGEEALEAGVAGYVQKGVMASDLLSLIRQVYSGN